MARIAGGLLKGLSITVPRQIRATEEKVRQALFNILGDHVEGARVLDGFAGSGALGLEALSRGAALVVFLEAHPACLRAIQQNLARIDLSAIAGRWQILRGDALQSLRALGRQGRMFDLVLLDPPYQGLWGKKALNAVAAYGMLSPTGSVLLEHARRNTPPSSVGPLALRKQHRYGDTVLSFYQLNSAAQNL